MWRIVGAVLLLACPQPNHSFSANRQVYYSGDEANCGYYDNPVFKLQHPPQSMVFLENRIGKEPSTYYNMFQEPETKQEKPLNSFFPNMTPANIKDLIAPDSHEEQQEEELDIDYEKVWQVGETPQSKVAIQVLPDVYVNREDTPPAVEAVPVEVSEITEEARDMDNAELQEKDLDGPSADVKEVIVETVEVRPEPQIWNSEFESFCNGSNCNQAKEPAEEQLKTQQTVETAVPEAAVEQAVAKEEEPTPEEAEEPAEESTDEK